MRERIIGPIGSFGLTIVIGICTGVGAAAFRGLIGIFHNFFFNGKLSVHYDASLHTPESFWGAGIILAPVLGAIVVTFLVTRFAPEARGHGVPEVIDAVYYHKGVIRPRVTWIKALASAISIGSGGSVGREGPIIQIGSAFGSWFGQLMRVPPWERITWLACGAGGGIAATFNTPIGGILFATEIILQEVSVRTLVPVALSTAVASYVGRIFFGSSPAFVIPWQALPLHGGSEPFLLFAYAGLGLLMGGASELFIQSIYRSEDWFDKLISHHPFVRHMTGMLFVGCIFYGLFRISGHYYVEGIGYSGIQDILSGRFTPAGPLIAFVALLFVAKLFVTAFTLGSGASGGVFSPALFLGATAGEAYGLLLHQLLPRLAVSPSSFAVVGMAGMVAGSTGAAVTAIVMVYEMTLDYSVIVPMTITVAISYGVRTLISRDSIYTLKLRRRGHEIPNALQANLAFIRKAADVTESRVSIFPASMHLAEFRNTTARERLENTRFFITEERGEVEGVFTFVDVMKASVSSPDSRLADLASSDYIVVQESSPISIVMEQLRRRNAKFILVTRKREAVGTFDIRDVRGVLPKERITDTLVEQSDLFSSDYRT